MTDESEAADAREGAETEQELTTDLSDDVVAISDLLDEAEEFEALYLAQVASSDYPDRLREAVRLLLENPTNFEPGDLVTWKPGLQNRYYPAEGAPAVVVGVTPGQVSPEGDPASSMFNEPLDLQLGVIDGEEDFVVFSFDRRRFTRWVDEDVSAEEA